MKLKDKTLLRTQGYIDGAWQDADTGNVFDVFNPADDSLVAHVADMGASETRRAIEAAQTAMATWRKHTGKERAAVLRKWFTLLMENQDDLAMIMTIEQGKPLGEAKGEVAYGANFVEWFAEEAKRAYGDTIPATARDKRIVIVKQPIGVVGAITPWNFPIAMITRKVAPALAAGCGIAVKPSEETPLCALAICELAHRAGVPAGLFSVIPCSKANAAAVGGELTSNEIVKKISFTGSTAVGRKLMEQSAKTVKRMGLELGGNAPFIVFDDANLDTAVAGAMASKFRNTGQTCVCANRIFVHEAIFDAFAQKLKVAVEKMPVGTGLEDGSEQGPLINDAGFAKVEKHVSDAISKGAKVITGGKPHSRGGRFYEPTILSNVSDDMILCHEETFGPVAPLISFKTENEVITMANDTEFGLAAYFYSENIGRVWRVAEALEAGMVGINDGVVSTEVAPFGGIKQSGLGREGSHYGLDDFLEIKYLSFANI